MYIHIRALCCLLVVLTKVTSLYYISSLSFLCHGHLTETHKHMYIEQCRSYQTRYWWRLGDTQTATLLTVWGSPMTTSVWSPALRTTANSGTSLTSRDLPQTQLGQSSTNGTMRRRRRRKGGVRRRGRGGRKESESCWFRVFPIQNPLMIFSVICCDINFHHLIIFINSVILAIHENSAVSTIIMVNLNARIAYSPVNRV